MDINQYLVGVKNAIGSLDVASVSGFAGHLVSAYENNKTIFVIGNGGSAANASHFAQDISKGVFMEKPVERGIKALSLTDNVAYITALGNDNGYHTVFSAQLNTFANEGDFLVAISGSGNSKNILDAVRIARQKNMFVIGVTGFDGGELKKASDFSVHVPLNDMCSVESVHSVIFHTIILELRERLANQLFGGL